MSTTSKIEWTDATWNAVTGCTKVSPGCDNCYAETFAERWRGVKGHHFENGFNVTLRPERLALPLKWRKPRRVFVNSMSDLFHKDVPDEYIARVFAVMALTPQHTYQVLTKRHGRMRSLLNSPEFEKQVDHELLTAPEFSDSKLTKRSWPLPKPGWPLSNVWLGVSVEDQARADLRIPALLDTPAAVRFLSCEPLLGPVDLTAWMPPVSPLPLAQAPRTWAEWTWPDWVPQQVREEIESFWGPASHRTPADWIRSMHEQGAPAFGSVVRLRDGFGSDAPMTTGRFVHAWNNIARLVREDGTFAYTSFHPRRDRRLQQPLRWVIVGGESGPGARPMSPQWVRSLRDQCTDAAVPFFFKQWGAWADTGRIGIGHFDRSHALIGDPLDDLGHRHLMQRVGKGRAGRDLDGRTWDQYPAAETAGGAR
ncbi:phage Gp37/Gp68 family protein [Streptomyces klenkii]|uniref:Phage Gp37/Gp68 family protein n=1 Tax=Streptomyces klenkii TaxID=1420899 RepID=A0A3B0ANE7_9ACTN|nr:phage Gp37/Gp68 family protein [Streptomyces klenkii]RKN61901.1 phage Gp37/Gp68 family protein [Streptomyces klenkii]